MDKIPQLSIIVPVWNVERFLPACLDSICRQTFTDWECILVDDGSPDSSGAICDAYAAKDGRFSVVHKENGGASSARNAGLERARGDYVYFFDSDDVMADYLLEFAMTTQLENPEHLTIWRSTSDWEEFQTLAGQKRVWRFCSQDEMQLIFLQIALHTGVNTKLFRHSILKEHGFSFVDPEGRKNAPGEDAMFSQAYMKLFLQEEGQGYCYLDMPLYYYRRDNPHSIMANQKKAPSPAAPASLKKIEAERQYCQTLLEEYRKRRQNYPAFFEGEENAFNTAQHYLRCFAYGVWCARALGEALPRDFWNLSEIRWLVEYCEKSGRFLPYYYPFKWRSAALTARLYEWDEKKNINFYRAVWLFKKLPGRRWNA